MKLPRLTPIQTSREMIDVFGGYNHNPRINDNEFYDMQNMSSDSYPLLSVRKKRGNTPDELKQVGLLDMNNGMIYRDRLIWISVEPTQTQGQYRVYLSWLENDGSYSYVPWLSDFDDSVFRHIIPMGAKIIVLPDKIAVNTVTQEKWDIENEQKTSGKVFVQPCLEDGTVLSLDYVGDSEPDNPPDGYVWLDTSLQNPALKKYYSSTAIWQPFIASYVKIAAADTLIGNKFKVGDVVRISGLSGAPAVLNATSIIRNISSNKKELVFNETLNVISDSGILLAREAQTGATLHFISDTNDTTKFENKLIKVGNNPLWECTSATVEQGNAYTYEIGDSTVSTSIKTLKSIKTADQSGSTINLYQYYRSVAIPEEGISEGDEIALTQEELDEIDILNVTLVRFGENGEVARIVDVSQNNSAPPYIMLDKSVNVPAGTTIYAVTQVEHPGKHMLALTFGNNSYTIKAGEKGCVSLESQYSQTAQVTISRKMPLMDYMIESQNRLWGCRYGNTKEDGTGEFVNEIYCSKLGDETNWEVYDGTVSTNSYRASIGSEGEWTGAANYRGYPVFFKEHHIHTVLGSYPPYQITDTIARGVQKGSSASLASVNEILYYKSTHGIMAYSGGLPADVSAPLGSQEFRDARACAFKNKYYVCLREANSQNHVFMVYDTARNLWHKEDGLYVEQFASGDNDVYYIIQNPDYVDNVTTPNISKYVTLTLFGGDDTTPIPWYVETGLLGLETVDRKYISRLNLRLKLPVGATMLIYIEYDSSGEWEMIGNVIGHSLTPFTLPIKPKRCDHFRLRLQGIGDMTLYSIAKTISSGSDR